MKHFLQRISDLVLISKPCARSGRMAPFYLPVKNARNERPPFYPERFIGPVINLFKKYLRPKGIVFLAHDVRRRCMVQFIRMVPGRFEMENQVKTMKGKEELHKVVIHMLRLK